MISSLSFAFAMLVLAVQSEKSRALDDTRPVLGISVIDANKVVKEWRDAGFPARMAPKKGLLISFVAPGSPAARIGIQKFDLLDKIGNSQVRTLANIDKALEKYQPGEMVPITIRRAVGTGWFPVEGKLICSTNRLFHYAQLKWQGSKVKETLRLHHCQLEGKQNLISPVIVISKNKPTLFLDVQHVGDNALFLQQVTIKFGGMPVSSDLRPGIREIDLSFEGPAIAERSVIPLSAEMELLLRSEGSEKMFRFDGETQYVEEALSEEWHKCVKTVLAVYDDMIATGKTDPTLGGRLSPPTDQ